MRLQLREVFAPELDALGAEGPVILDLLDVLFGPEIWSLLLEHQGHSHDQASLVLAAGARRLLVR